MPFHLTPTDGVRHLRFQTPLSQRITPAFPRPIFSRPIHHARLITTASHPGRLMITHCPLAVMIGVSGLPRKNSVTACLTPGALTD